MQTLGSKFIARNTNRLKNLSSTRPDNGLFPGIQHFAAPNVNRAPVSLPFYDHGALLESIYSRPTKPLLTASPEDLRMNLGFRAGNGIEPLAAKNGLSGTGAVSASYVSNMQQWPQDRQGGLTYGEIQTINAWLRDYGVPSLTDNTTRNARGELPRDAVNKIWVAWQNCRLTFRDQMQNAMRMHLSMYGFDTGRGQSAYWQGFNIGWPLVRTGAGSIQSKINSVGMDGWLRYVGAMAIGRDLFAEDLAEVGGVQPGLVDTVADVQLEGTAVSGEWQNLAGVWRWKGYDLLSRPLNVSVPLFPPPQVPPADVDASRARNVAFFMKFYNYPSVAAAISPTLTTAVPALLSKYRGVITARTNASPISSVPPTVQGYAALWAALFNVLGLDIKRLLGATYDQAMTILDAAPAAGVSGVGLALPSGAWQGTALKITQTASQILEGSINKAAKPAAAPEPFAVTPPPAAPVDASSGGAGLMLAAAALGALMLL